MHVNRRDFVKYCLGSAAALGLDISVLGRLEEALAGASSLPTVIWLNGANCTGCTVSLANMIGGSAPTDVADLLINTIDLAFHPNLMGAAGDLAVESLNNAAAGDYVLVVDGGIPTAFDGHTCLLWTETDQSGSKREVTAMEAVQRLAPGALALVSVGTCSCFGGIPSGDPNPTGVVAPSDLTGIASINIPGCPPHPDWIVWTLAQLIAGAAPTLDSDGRPATLFSGSSCNVHRQCPRRERDETENFGRDGYCLEELGCKGPLTQADCPTRKWNNNTNWCIGANAICLGCTERGFPDRVSPFYRETDDDYNPGIGRPGATSPVGAINGARPEFTWSAASGATLYLLKVDGESGEVIREWYKPSAITSGSTCSVTSPVALQQGTYTWRAQAFGGSGFSSVSERLSFSVSVSAAPGKATLIEPSDSISDATPTYRWSAVQGASYYYLWVNDASGAVVIKQWFTAEEAAAGSTCAVTPAKELKAGNHTWWVQTWNPQGYGPWSAAMKFSVAVSSPPKQVVPLAPSGSISDGSPEFRWEAAESATWYYLWINDQNGTMFRKWYTAAEVASGGVCAVTPPLSLAAGSYKWWVQPYNSKGYGPWSAVAVFSVSVSATPGKPTLVSPSGSISAISPRYTWRPVAGATWYLLWVNDETGNIAQKWYRADDVTSGSECAVTYPINLSPGSFRWWIRAWNSAGDGPWSDGMGFSVS